MDYRSAGVDTDLGRSLVKGIAHRVQRAKQPGVLAGIGGFAGLFALPGGMKNPVLVAGTDGVGTKLMIAQACQQHTSVGIDLVAMCVNDVLTVGGKPLFFLDYLATGKLQPDSVLQVIDGIIAGCEQADCALLGGETAEMPGFYGAETYDLAGFCVGVVEQSAILDGSQVQVGDRVWGLPSSGVHSNGFSLVRRIVAAGGWRWQDVPTGWTTDLAETFLTPTRIYVKEVLAALAAGLPVHGMAHITGGGWPENLPRCLGSGQSIQVDLRGWRIPPIFAWLQTQGQVSLREMFRTFNMGMGLALIVPPDVVVSLFLPDAFVVGEVVAGSGEVVGLPDD
ncbi:MAG: phosphoribosylformylglycinamidine cyclo-ligase [Cyanobacteriota bacterium]|nr:phosphoribosylformylglycinamidine cyclo-ligase [Cyanobacteriota bacterium]